MTTAPYDPRSGNTPDARPIPYDPRSGNMPDSPAFTPAAVVVTQSGERIEIDSSGKSASGNTPVGSTKPLASNTVFTPVATIITQSGEEIQIDNSGKAADGSVPVGSTKSVITGGGSGSGTGAGTGAGTGTGTVIKPGQEARQSAYDLLNEQFTKMGLGALVEPLKGLIISGSSPAEFTIKLRETPAYQKRFSANAERIKKGLTAIDESAYLKLEDQYQNVMRNYGLPESYYTRGELGVQEGFNKLIANDVSNVELETRIMTAQDRVLKSNPQVLDTLKQFYPGITNGDILAYSLDPVNALKDIQRKVTAAEIGGAALSQTGLTTSLARAEELQKYGVDKAAATAGYSAIGDSLQRGSQLASIYGESPYTQATAESEVFKLSGQQEARKQRQKVTGLEKATFGGQTGLTSGALARDRAGGY
jgi:hypothetical protein